MTLYDAFKAVIMQPTGNYFYEEMVESKRKWHEAIMTQSQLILLKNAGVITQEEKDTSKGVLQKMINHFYDKMEKAEGGLSLILDKEVPLTGVKQIQSYTEFDKLEWDIETDGKVKIKFKPKGVAVSFWHADPKQIEYVR